MARGYGLVTSPLSGAARPSFEASSFDTAPSHEHGKKNMELFADEGYYTQSATMTHANPNLPRVPTGATN